MHRFRNGNKQNPEVNVTSMVVNIWCVNVRIWSFSAMWKQAVLNQGRFPPIHPTYSASACNAAVSSRQTNSVMH